VKKAKRWSATMVFYSPRISLVSGLVALFVGGTAHATTINYVQTSGGSCCTVDAHNMVQVSDTTLPNGSTPLDAGVFDIFVTLATNWSFQQNDGDNDKGHAASFAFSSSLTTISIPAASITSPFFANSINPMDAFSMSPWKFPANGYGVSQNESNETVYSTLDFHVDTGNSYTLDQFIATLLPGTNNDYPDVLFSADAQDGSCGANCGNTGAIGFTYSGITNNEGGLTPVPLPGALPLFATLLGALGLVRWCRKRKSAAAFAAA
jgi:hypothetical protein